MEKESKRCGKYSVEEKNLLLLLALKEKESIESKTKNAGCLRQIESIWENIASEYNALTKGEPKDARSLRLKYFMMKRKIEKDSANKKSSLPKPKKSKEESVDDLKAIDEDSSQTMGSTKWDFSKEFQASTPQNESILKREDIDKPTNEMTVDPVLDCNLINKLPPQKIPIYDAAALSSELDEIVRKVMTCDKELSTDSFDEDTNIDIHTPPSRGHYSAIDTYKRESGKKIQVLHLQKKLLGQFMRHKREEHKLKMKHMETEHQLRIRGLRLNLAKEMISSEKNLQ